MKSKGRLGSIYIRDEERVEYKCNNIGIFRNYIYDRFSLISKFMQMCV